LFKNLHTLLHIDELCKPSFTAADKNTRPLLKVLMRDLAKVVLFSYVFLIFNSLTPIVADVLAHTFWEKQHLLTVHQIKGKYHVHFELINSEKQSDSKAPGNLKSGTDDYVYLVFNTRFHFVHYNTLTSISNKPYIYPFYPRLLMDIDYPPPRG
jgi:hypothetical protein